MDKLRKVLLVEDNPGDAFFVGEIVAEITGGRLELATVESLAEAMEYLATDNADAALLDLELPDSDGIDTVRRFREAAPWVPAVVLTGNDDPRVGLEVVKAGAQDYLVKGKFSGDLLERVIRYAMERHQTNEILQESEAFLRTALDSLSSRIAIIDDSGGVLSVNRAWRSLAEKEHCVFCNALEGDDYLDACVQVPDEELADAVAFSGGIRCVMSGEKRFFEKEFPCMTTSGKIWFRASVTPFPGKGPGQVVISLEDITEMRKAAEELRNSELRLRTILDAQASAVIHVGTDLKVLWPNRTACEAAGLVRNEIIGKPCHAIWRERAKGCKDCPVVSAIESGTPQVRLQKDASGKSWRVLACPVRDDSGRIVSAVEVFEDITRSLDLERQLRQSQKMEAIGTLAGGVAHDFNNVLASIIGFTQLALDEAEKGSVLADNLQEVYAAGRRAKGLVKQILTFARQSDEKPRPIRAERIVKETLAFLRSFIPATICVRQRLESRATIIGDPTQLHQLLMNLCNNAVQAMEKGGGELGIVLKDISISGDREALETGLPPGRYVEIEVADTGPGIAPELIESIFEPYVTTKKVGEGTGLGLAVAHGIIESHRGKIVVESEPGNGAVFKVYLPALEGMAMKKNFLYESEVLPSGDERILLVDDEDFIVRMASRLLEKMGYSVTSRTSSIAALELFRSRPDDFDLVITDMTMPNMTGDLLAAEMLKIRPTLPVILCTGFSKKTAQDSARKLGVKFVLTKPFEKEYISKCVRNVLDEAKGAGRE